MRDSQCIVGVLNVHCCLFTTRFSGQCYQALLVSIKTSLFTGNLGCEWEGAWHGYACFSDGFVSKCLRLFSDLRHSQYKVGDQVAMAF